MQRMVIQFLGRNFASREITQHEDVLALVDPCIVLKFGRQNAWFVMSERTGAQQGQMHGSFVTTDGEHFRCNDTGPLSVGEFKQSAVAERQLAAIAGPA